MAVLAIFIAAIVGVTVIIIFVGLWYLLPRDEVAERMHELVGATLADTSGTARIGTGMAAKEALQRLNTSMLSRGLGQGITDNLLQANLKLTAAEYILIVVGITLFGALLGYVLSGHPISILLAALISFFLPAAFVNWRKAIRRKLFSQQLPEALGQLAGSLRAGYSLLQSLETVQKQMSWPVNEEFTRVVREVQLGQSLQMALINMSERIVSDDLIMVTSSINIHQQVGGNLAEVLDTVAETLRERFRIKREVEVLTAQQRISGYVLVALPIALAIVLLILNPEYEMRLFTPGITLCIPCGALLSMIAGYIIMRRIVDIDV
jgi:tight adherence protein B